MKRFLAMFMALTMLTGTTPIALAADRGSGAEGYYESRLTDDAAIAFYDALEKMDFASGENLSVDDPAVIGLAEAYAGGSVALIRSFGAAVDSFRYDHMEYFYVDWDMLSVSVGKKNGEYVVNIGTGRTDSYLCDKDADIGEQVRDYNYELEAMVDKVWERVDDADASVKEIADAANYVVCESVEYDFCDDEDGNATEASKYIRTAYGALVNGRGVCEGYSRLYKAVLDELAVEHELAIECELVSGYYLNGESYEPHMWNYVKDEDGHWYAVDVTMNDSNRSAVNDKREYSKYFWQTKEFFGVDHIEDGKVSSVEYKMPYPKLYENWNIAPTGSGRFEYGTGAYEGQTGFWFSFDGKSAEELKEQDGLYMAFRTSTTNNGMAEWSHWQSVDEYERLIPGSVPSEEGKTYFLLKSIAVQELEVGIFDIPEDDDEYSEFASVYSDEAVRSHLIEKTSVENPLHDEDYIAPAHVRWTKPSELFQRMQDITETQHVELEYSMPLRVVEGKEFEITWDVSSYNTRDLSLEAVQKNAKLENPEFDGDRTISFDFTPSRAFNHNMIFYNFTVHNVVNVLNDESDGVALPGFTIMYEYKDSIACCKIYNDGRLYVNAYAQPSIAMNGDLSMTGWKYEDENGDIRQVSESQRSQVALVVTQPDNSDALIDAVDEKVGQGAVGQPKTYEIDLNICGKILQIPNGSYMRLNLGIPDEFENLADNEDITFKLYHFKRDSETGELDYKNPEEIQCVLTPYGIIAEITSFSPYVLVAVDNSELAEGDTTKNVALVCNGHGGKVEGNAVATLSNPEDEVTYTLEAEDGYEVEFAYLNGKDVVIEDNAITLTYDELESSNTLEVGFVAESVKEAEADAGINNVAPGAACTVTFYTDGGSAIPSVHVERGSKIEKPEDPTKRKYKFSGWYTDKECEEAYDFETPVDASMTLYAKWIKKNSDDGTTSDEPTSGGTTSRPSGGSSSHRVDKAEDKSEDKHEDKPEFLRRLPISCRRMKPNLGYLNSMILSNSRLSGRIPLWMWQKTTGITMPYSLPWKISCSAGCRKTFSMPEEI